MKLRRLLRSSGYFQSISEGQLVALKVHVGERENLAYLNPNFAAVGQLSG